MILASQEMIREWTEKGAWGKKTLIDFFKENVKKDPDKECLVDPLNKKDLVGLEPERLTYRQLDKAVDATAESLIARGIQKDDIIMVQLPQLLGACHAVPCHYKGGGIDIADADAVALIGGRLYCGNDGGKGLYHGRRFSRFQAQRDGRKKSGLRILPYSI